MELFSEISKIARKRAMRKKSMKDYDIFLEVAKRYAQTTDTTTLAPDDIQVGQSVFDPNDEEFIVLESEDAATTKVLMPAEQLNTGGLPESVQTVDDVALESDYTLQPSGAQTGVTAFHKVLPEFREKKRAGVLKEFQKKAQATPQDIMLEKIQELQEEFQYAAYALVGALADYSNNGDLNKLDLELSKLRVEGIPDEGLGVSDLRDLVDDVMRAEEV